MIWWALAVVVALIVVSEVLRDPMCVRAARILNLDEDADEKDKEE